ncbi:MAG: hypothetical protein ACW98I_14990 [Candidatus Hodarchaeales archaeon]|jgi:hypothetical protein
MSEKKLDEIETMFKTATKPKTVIDKYPVIEHIGCVLDSSTQGFNALQVASALAQRLKTKLDIFVSEDYHKPLRLVLESNEKELKTLSVTANDFMTGTEDLEANITPIISDKVQQAFDLFFQEKSSENETLFGRLVENIKTSGIQVCVLGVPLFVRSDIEWESMGTYVLKLLRERELHVNWLLVSAKQHIIADSVLAFVSVEQQPASIIALYRRALSFATEHTNFKIVGIVEDNVIETVARLEISDDSSDVPDLENARKKLITSMEDTLGSIQLKQEIDDVIIEGSPTWEVKSGHISEIVREYIESEHPGIVFVRSVAEMSENLDPFAEVVTRQVLQTGFNCLIVWD